MCVEVEEFTLEISLLGRGWLLLLLLQGLLEFVLF
jgi:hypothetical protein